MALPSAPPPRAGRPAPFLLFLASEPTEEAPVNPEYWSILYRISGGALSADAQRRLAVALSSPSTEESPTPRASGANPGYLSREMLGILKLVTELAQKARASLTSIDVSVPGENAELVRKWYGADDVLPMLVGPDGSKMEGLVEFTPSRVREFINRKAPASIRSDRAPR
jgi:hypothetical protein